MNYKLLNSIGKGGFAEVFQAVREDGLLVAMKVFAWPLQAYSQEVSSLHFLSDNPHVVKLVEEQPSLQNVPPSWPFLDPPPCFAMEFCKDGSLEQWAHSRHQPEEIARVMRDILEGLVLMHEQGGVHRDIKPGNILFDGEQAKLADLGSAWFPSHERYVDVDGGYVAPELKQNPRSASCRCDVYSLGLVLRSLFRQQYLSTTLERQLRLLERQMTADDPLDRPSADQCLSLLSGFLS